MPFGLCELAYFLHEAERPAKILKPESVLDLAGLIAHLPLRNLFVKALGLFRRQWRDAALAGRACFFNQGVDHLGSPSSQGLPSPRATKQTILRSARRHSLVGKFLDRVLALGEIRHPHPAQHVRRLGELDVVVADDLKPVAPWIKKVEEAPGQWLDTGLGKGLAHRLFVIDHQPEMPPVICRLRPAFLQREELIAKIDKSGVFAIPPQLELEQAAVEGQCLFDVADLECDVVETDGARLLRIGHRGSPFRSHVVAGLGLCNRRLASLTPGPPACVTSGRQRSRRSAASPAGSVYAKDDQDDRSCHEHPARMTPTCSPKVADSTKQVEAANE